MEDANKAIDIAPDHYYGYSERYRLYFEMDRYEDMIPDCTKAISIDPNRSDAYYWRSRAYDALGKSNLGVKDDEKYAELREVEQKEQARYNQ